MNEYKPWVEHNRLFAGYLIIVLIIGALMVAITAKFGTIGLMVQNLYP